MKALRKERSNCPLASASIVEPTSPSEAIAISSSPFCPLQLHRGPGELAARERPDRWLRELDVTTFDRSGGESVQRAAAGPAGGIGSG